MSDKPPTPDEISKQLEKFLKDHMGSMGNSVNFGSVMGSQDDDLTSDQDLSSDDDHEDIHDFHYRPRDIKTHLDRFVIRQDEAKKVLSIAVCDHYNHAKFLHRLAEEDPEKAAEVEFAKQNVIVAGPTGVGKTYLIKHIADLIGVPFVKADATKFSETGYVGGDVDDLIRELVQKADGNVSRAEYGIVYIDEIDKLASKGEMIGRDVSGRGVQTTLLKLMEETEVPLRNPQDVQGQIQMMMGNMGRPGKGNSKDSINTRHILFIVSGAFSGLEKIINKRIRSNSIGFGADAAEVSLDSNLFQHISTQDFIDYGLEAEFVGRLPVRVICEPLTPDDMLEIMTTSEGSILHQYEREFDSYGIKVSFDDSALKIIAERAAKENTGARGMLTVCERILRDFKFELPGSAVSEFVIDRELIMNPEKKLKQFRSVRSREKRGKVEEQVSIFTREFKDRHQVKISLTDDCLDALALLSEKEDVSILQLCKQAFKDYQFGLKLIQNNTGQSEFTIDGTALSNPDDYLSQMVLKACNYGKKKSPGETPNEGKAEES